MTLFFAFFVSAQDSTAVQGHKNNNNFKQLYEEFATPNRFRTAAGAPGVDYYQQQVDYKMDIRLDDANTKLYGSETITYTNNSPDALPYLWIQLDQNIRNENDMEGAKEPSSAPKYRGVNSFIEEFTTEKFVGGFNIEHVKDASGRPLRHTINQTMMRVDLPTALQSGEQYTFSIKWWYKINNHVTDRARSGYEYFEEDDNRAYVIAQFFPRLAVYNDVEGWQNYQFWGNGEFALNFGNYEVNITVPEDHIMEATGSLQNPKEVLTKTEYQRYKKALNTFDNPVIIVSQDEVVEKEKVKATKTKTWRFVAENVRDFGFATSRRFIWDMMAVKVGGKNIIASSLYPKEGNPLWEEYSTRVVAHTLEVYSKYTFDYPYPKAVSVHAKNQGMEYPMICWNYGRPNPDGTYSDRTKYGMISVIIHEVGHNYFPMIVNSDERQWGWMDEGLDTFMQYLTEQEFQADYPSRRGEPSKIVRYMSGDQDFISPIMSNPENVFQLGPNAYGKPATALNILRETIMGPELFDFAFKTYSQRWMFKHPSPEDFFRTMEDASAVDLDWFWRGWFYSTDVVDIGVKEVKRYYVSPTPSKEVNNLLARYGMTADDLNPSVFMVAENSEEFDASLAEGKPTDHSEVLASTLEEGQELPAYFYEIEFEKPGGIVMPIIVEYSYADGTTERITYPVQVWRKNDASVKKLITSDKELIGVTVDPDAKTADIDLTNNAWPKQEADSDFDAFKAKVQG
ncbi:M1 family metallopeptidase [Flavobacteriaceae bacterium]|nr:M1 family metallopeptidase [Flavobacteriaceae bacterium]MDB4113309.1 M1 family metallopeptidase [Flavobacteriaceae bacterium]MDB4187116.1 M1 family metallopeptidase [Flavobacteriaceae bacterium]MDB9885985.1 M1 family metallopeptidase [Flavobacteriaceae bacterium]